MVGAQVIDTIANHSSDAGTIGDHAADDLGAGEGRAALRRIRQPEPQRSAGAAASAAGAWCAALSADRVAPRDGWQWARSHVPIRTQA